MRRDTNNGALQGVDPSPVERPGLRDRRTDLLHDFFTLCRWELAADAGAKARAYLEQRGLPTKKVAGGQLGVVPDASSVGDCLRASGYSDHEIAQSGVLSDSRWPGRLCGAWRGERGKIQTLWTRSLNASASDTRYLYLRGANRSVLPPYGLSWVLKSSSRARELTLVEGFLDVHHLRARGYENVAALGGTGTRGALFERLAQLGLERIVLCLDNDAAGREATAKAVEHAASASASPEILVIDPERLASAKDPDEFVREHGIERWRQLAHQSVCGVVWRSLQFVSGVEPTSSVGERRKALAAAGAWLGMLPARLALEQEDALQAVAERCDYSIPAVQRAFRARFWCEPAGAATPKMARGL